jgi:hypothetical protein
MLRKLWAGWKAFALRLGKVQTAILLAVVYHLTVGPIGLIARLARRDLLALRGAQGSYWTALPQVTSTVEQAEKQF